MLLSEGYGLKDVQEWLGHSDIKMTANIYGHLDIRHKRSIANGLEDNALAENFFGILKAECIYRHKPETFEEANKMIDDYIYFYNHERIQLKTGLPPLSLRQSC